MPIGEYEIARLPIAEQLSPTWTVPVPLIIPPGQAEVYLVEALPYDPALGAERLVRLSTHGYVTLPSEDPPDASFPEAIENAFNVSQRLGLLEFGRIGKVTAGEIRILLSRGAGTDLLDLYWDRRPVTVRLGAPTWRYADFTVVFRGFVSSISAGGGVLTLTVLDAAARLKEQFQAATYGGAGGFDGGAELKGVPLPYGVGSVFNAEPVPVDRVNGWWQVCSVAINDILAVKDAGVPYTRVDGTPEPGEFQADLENGRFRIAGDPAGVLTVDFEGDATDGYAEGATAVLNRVLRGPCGFGDSDIGSLSLGTAPAGFYAREGGTREEVIDGIVAGLGAWWGIDRLSRATARLIEAPAATAVASFGPEDIVTPGPALLPTMPPVRKVTVGYQRNWRRMTEAELAGAVTSASRAELTEESKRATWPGSGADDPEIASLHPLARSLELPAVFRDAADAEAAARRLGAFYGHRRPRAWRVPVRGPRHRAQIGATVRITWPGLGLQDGRNVIVDGYEESARTGTTILTVIG